MSDLETKILEYDKLQLTNSCKNYETLVDAKQGNHIMNQMPDVIMK